MKVIKNMNQFEELSRLYERALKVIPEFVTQDNLDYYLSEDYIQDGKTYARFIPQKISIQNLFNKVKSEYLNIKH